MSFKLICLNCNTKTIYKQLTITSCAGEIERYINYEFDKHRALVLDNKHSLTLICEKCGNTVSEIIQ